VSTIQGFLMYTQEIQSGHRLLYCRCWVPLYSTYNATICIHVPQRQS